MMPTDREIECGFADMAGVLHFPDRKTYLAFGNELSECRPCNILIIPTKKNNDIRITGGKILYAPTE